MRTYELLLAVDEETDRALEMMVELIEFFRASLGGGLETLLAHFVLQLRQEHHLELLCHFEEQLGLGFRREIADAFGAFFIGCGDAANQVRAEGGSLQGVEPKEAEVVEVLAFQNGIEFFTK